MDTFFGIRVSFDTLGGMTLALALAVLMGGLIGLERELHGHPAGLRTHILVCLGSTLITLVSVHMSSKSDPARLAAQIVTGIGFLGAGAIIREGATVRGLTTAASIWTTAGIGIALGAGPFLSELALVATLLVLFTLWILNKAEDWINVKSHRLRTLEVQVHDSDSASAHVLARVSAHEVFIQSIRHDRGAGPHLRQMALRVRLPDNFDRHAFLADLADEAGVHSVDLE